MTLVKRYWLEILFFSLILGYYLVGVTPCMTWMSQSGDSYDYVVSAKNFWAARPTGYPVFISIGWLFMRLPGDDFWSLALLSAIPSFMTCIVIFLMVKHFTTNRLAPYIGTLTYAGSFLVWSQSIVPEVYSLNTLVMLLIVYFAIKGKWYLSAACMAVGVGLHHLIVFAIFPTLVYLLYEKYKGLPTPHPLVVVGIMCIGFLSYLQVQLNVGSVETTSGMSSFFSQSNGSFGFVLGLPLWKTWERVLEAVPILLTGLGVGLTLLVFLPKRKEILLVGSIAVACFCYYFFSNIPMWLVYAMPTFAFGAVLVGVGAGKFPYRREWLVVFLIPPIVFMGLNLAYYDIGRTLDRLPTSAQEFYSGLSTLPDNSILYIHTYGEPWLTTYYYSVEEGNRFLFLFEGELKYHPEDYRPYKEGMGISLPQDFDKYGEKSLNDLYYAEWDRSLFLNDLVLLNPSKEVYTVEKYSGKTWEEVQFTFVRWGNLSK